MMDKNIHLNIPIPSQCCKLRIVSAGKCMPDFFWQVDYDKMNKLKNLIYTSDFPKVVCYIIGE